MLNDHFHFEPVRGSWAKPLPLFVLCIGVLAAGRSDVRAEDPFSSDAVAAAPSQAAPRPDVDALVAQLGSPSFREREVATRRLLEIGQPAVARLKVAADGPDREIRVRSAHLLGQIDLAKREERIRAFLNGEADESGAALPGWEMFRELVEDSPDSRAMFAEMLEADWDLLAALAFDNGDVGRQFELRVQEHRFGGITRNRLNVDVPTVATLMFVGAAERAQPSDQDISMVNSLCRRASKIPRKLLQQSELSPKDAVFCQIVAAWVSRDASGNSLLSNISLATAFDLEVSADLADRYLSEFQAGNLRSVAYRKIVAILAIGKHGNNQHRETLEKLLDDETMAYHEKDPRSKEIGFQVQVRDAALACLMRLDGMDPKKNGFKRLQSHPTTLYTSNTVGFATEAERTAAFQAWKAHLDNSGA